MKRHQMQNWIVLDLRRVDPMMPGMLIGERRLFRFGPELSRPVLTTQIRNRYLDPEAAHILHLVPA